MSSDQLNLKIDPRALSDSPLPPSKASSWLQHLDPSPPSHTLTSLDSPDTPSPGPGPWEKVTSCPRSWLRNFCDRMSKIDAYAISERPHTLLGSVITVAIWLASLAYTIWLIYEYTHQSPIQETSILWSVRDGPFPAVLQCLTSSGCYVSNYHEARWTRGAKVEEAQTRCYFMKFWERTTINVTYSLNPLDGLHIIYNGSDTPADSPPLFGLFLSSSVVCGDEDEGCVDGQREYNPPIGPGLNFLTLVHTENDTAKGLGASRREWYVNQVSRSLEMVPGVSDPCLVEFPELLQSDDYIKSGLLMESSYTKIHVYYQSILLLIIGSVGGAYSLFLQAGLLLLTTGFVMSTVWGMRSTRLLVAPSPRPSDADAPHHHPSKGDAMHGNSLPDGTYGSSLPRGVGGMDDCSQHSSPRAQVSTSQQKLLGEMPLQSHMPSSPGAVNTEGSHRAKQQHGLGAEGALPVVQSAPQQLVPTPPMTGLPRSQPTMMPSRLSSGFNQEGALRGSVPPYQANGQATPQSFVGVFSRS